MEMVYGKTKKAKNMLENGKLIKLMVTESILHKIVIFKVIIIIFKANSIILINMAMEYKHSQTETFIKEIT